MTYEPEEAEAHLRTRLRWSLQDARVKAMEYLPVRELEWQLEFSALFMRLMKMLEGAPPQAKSEAEIERGLHIVGEDRK